MKKSIKRASALILSAFLLIAAFAGCSSRNENMSASSSQASYSYDYAPEAENEDYYSQSDYAAQEAGAEAYPGEASGTLTGGGTTVTQPKDNRKIIINSDIDMETKGFNDSSSKITSLINEAGGYVSSSSSSGSEGFRHLYLTAKIPAENYSRFIEQLNGSGTVISKNERSDDITSQYTDVESRLRSLRTQEDRLIELMEKSGNLKDLLEVQRTLTEVQYEIDRYASTQKGYDHLVAYSTVNINLNEVREITVVSEGFGSKMATAFKKGWTSAGNSLQNFLIFIARNLPTLIFLGALAAVGVVVTRRQLKKNNAKKEAQKNNGAAPPDNKPDINIKD